MPQRLSYSLDGMWLFQIDREETGQQQGWFAPDIGPEGWLTVPVPGNWDTYLPEFFGYTGLAWYRRTLRADPSWRGQQVTLRFEGANYATKVWLNGQELGQHEGGFVPFQLSVAKTEKEDLCTPPEDAHYLAAVFGDYVDELLDLCYLQDINPISDIQEIQTKEESDGKQDQPYWCRQRCLLSEPHQGPVPDAQSGGQHRQLHGHKPGKAGRGVHTLYQVRRGDGH